jgi:hypothetical protein
LRQEEERYEHQGHLFKLVTGAGVIAILIISSNPSAFAKTVTVNGLTETQSITGGTGIFAHASGSIPFSITFTVIGTGLAAPGSPPGAFGSFGAFQYTTSGSVSF